MALTVRCCLAAASSRACASVLEVLSMIPNTSLLAQQLQQAQLTDISDMLKGQESEQSTQHKGTQREEERERQQRVDLPFDGVSLFSRRLCCLPLLC